MSSISIEGAINTYGGKTLCDVINNMVSKNNYVKIYLYTNQFTDDDLHTDFKRFTEHDNMDTIISFLGSRNIRHDLKVYDNGHIL
jgi:hypothetical protein